MIGLKPGTPTPPPMRRTLVAAASASLGPLALNALSVPAMAFIIRRLGPTGYGQWAVATSLLAVTAVLTNLGLRGAFVRAVAADPNSAPAALADQLGLRLALAAAASATVVAACGLLRYSRPVHQCVALGAVGLTLTTVATTLGDLLQALHRVRTLAAVNLAAGLSLTAASLVAAACAGGPVAIAAAYLTGPLFAAAALAVIVRRRCGCPVSIRWHGATFRRLIVSSRFFAAQQLLAVGGAQAEALLLPRLVGLQQFGFFNAGTLLASRLTALPDGLCTAAYPAMAAAGDAGRTGALAARCLLVAAGGGAMVAACGSLAAEPIGRLLFPGAPALFATVVRVTIWSLPLFGVESVMGYALNAAGADRAKARVSVPAAMASLAVSVALVATLGVTGACWSMLLRPAVRAAFLAPTFVRTFWPATGDVAASCAVA
jgi:O-antigen/teichoic acid export membrane protein